MPTIQEVVSKFPQHVQQRYDFTNAVYESALKPITKIVCSKHGEFQQYSAQLRKDGAGCPACGAEQRAHSRRMEPREFIDKVDGLHNHRYSYEKTNYINMTTKVTVTCRDHGDFEISPIKHLYDGQGCPSCGSISRGKRLDVTSSARKTADAKIKIFSNRFVDDAIAVHGDRYSYEKVVYLGAKTKVDIVCKDHGIFSQTPEHHLKRGYGCPQCGHILSKQEDRITKFLSMLTMVESRNRKILGGKELDIYLPEKNMAIEYCGMYWHSHEDQEDEAKNKRRHIDKHRACHELGIKLITIYESEWEEHEYAIRRLLRNAVGKSKGRLMARKCELKKVDPIDARRFYDKYHPQGGNGSGVHYGLYHNNKLVACMRFSFGANDRGSSERTWTLSRFATRVTVVGAGSRLFQAFLQDVNPTEVKSFSDNRYFDGGMYERLGFKLEADLPADYQVWSQKIGLWPKSHYQRRNIPKRLIEHGIEEAYDPESDPRSEADMTYMMGARRIFDCGKKRWVYKLIDTHPTN
jgi:Zn finger protein HypA/HybF involved in hydrogenase expression